MVMIRVERMLVVVERRMEGPEVLVVLVVEPFLLELELGGCFSCPAG